MRESMNSYSSTDSDEEDEEEDEEEEKKVKNFAIRASLRKSDGARAVNPRDRLRRYSNLSAHINDATTIHDKSEKRRILARKISCSGDEIAQARQRIREASKLSASTAAIEKDDMDCKIPEAPDIKDLLLGILKGNVDDVGEYISLFEEDERESLSKQLMKFEKDDSHDKLV